jgi:metal-responsive CopG/Arc/MetJ family transcriptional regulator
MAVLTIDMPFQEELLDQSDKVARNRAESRSEFLCEMASVYSIKKKWEAVFSYGESLSSEYQFTEEDVADEIRKYKEDKAGI